MVIGASTTVLASLNAGDSILDLVGPLGKKTDIRPDMGTVVCIGGGIGVAPIYPIARKMKQVGNHVITIMGAKNKDILKDEMEKISDEVIVTKCERKAPKFIYGDISSLKNNDSISLFFIVLYF